ncbi:MAG: transcriptional repressor [Bacteroidales bacterium]|nr:transcriptional repressor [Bacteroidales bacterium]
MEDSTLISLMEHHGVKPTVNRILIARALSGAGRPMSMTELEERLETIDKSSVFRTLTLFRDAHLVHVLEDAGDGVRYELCHSHHDDEDDDVHVHFYCEKCHRTLCLENIPVPHVCVPEGFESHTVSYLLKGICPDCR